MFHDPMFSIRHPVDRRRLLSLSAFGLTGLLANSSQVRASENTPHRAIINIHLDGGAPQHETFDPKPDAPEEIRGDIRPIRTTIPGVFISELMPKLASIAKDCVFIRSLVGSVNVHDAFQCQSGFSARDLRTLGGRPAVGSIIQKLLGSTTDTSPSFVDIMQGRPQVRNSARPGFLGPTYNPFRPDISQMFQRELEAGMVTELARRGEQHKIELELVSDLSPERLSDRLSLLNQFDSVRRQIDSSGSMEALDQFTQQAASVLTSGRFANALNLETESAKTLARYTAPASNVGVQSTTSEDRFAGRKLLLARKLVEAGVRAVSVSFSDFDTHSNNFPRMKNLLPIVDHAIHAFIIDLKERGLWDRVCIIVWGEFGRTPRVNKSGGRDHWPRVGPALLAGGSINTGMVLGATNKWAEDAIERPISYQDIFATLYHHMGIDAANTTILDTTGRPQYLVPEGKVIVEVAN
ncbi:MAG: DUF1501 domain-containing protein [Zavarzinella sp.]